MPEGQGAVTTLDVALWQRFAAFPDRTLRMFLAEEYPQTIVIILNLVEQVVSIQRANEIARLLGEALQAEIIRRRGLVADVRWWVILEIEKALRAEIAEWATFYHWDDAALSRWYAQRRALIDLG